MEAHSKIEATVQPDSNGLTPLYQNKEVMVKAVLGIDNGTKTQKLMVVLEYPNGDGIIAPCLTISLRKLDSYKGMIELLDMQGITDIEEVKAAWENYQRLRKAGQIGTVSMGDEKCSVTQAHVALTKYVTEYMEPCRVFVRDDYGHIESSYVPHVLKKLELGYEKLELYRNFKLWGLIRLNAEGTGHSYTYKIGRNWYFSFKLAKQASKEEGEQA